MTQTLLHLIYIHGFQGNDTSFQAFPTDLHRYLVSKIPSRFSLKSSLYPTYKSVKPLSYATNNFLEWLSTQPPGPVILVGHSMGGLLAADAATDASMKGRNRIVAIVAFDTPYLGMHPHVIISGITSLLPKNNNKDAGKMNSEKEMNDERQVDVVDDKVTDDWELFKQEASRPDGQTRHSSSSLSLNHLQSPSRSPSPSLRSQISNFLSSHADDPLLLWWRRHSDAPFDAGRQWIVEHFQFGICMFEPQSLRDRYKRLVAWDGHWVNYWTQTPSYAESHGRPEDRERERKQTIVENDAALIEAGMAGQGRQEPAWVRAAGGQDRRMISVPDVSGGGGAISHGEFASEPSLAMEEGQQGQDEAQKRKPSASEKDHSSHHFSVLPTGLGRILGGGDKWENVKIRGVSTEVEAHTGLFIPSQNLDYDHLVERVGNKILGWCGDI